MRGLDSEYDREDQEHYENTMILLKDLEFVGLENKRHDMQMDLHN